MRLFFLIFLTVFFSFVQTMGFSMFGVKPNLALVAVIVASFFVKNIWEALLLVILSATMLKFKPVFGQEIIIFSLIGAAAIFLKRRLIWQPLINCLVLIATATVLFYIFLSPSLILSTIFLKEIIYNLILGVLIFYPLSWLKKIYF